MVGASILMFLAAFSVLQRGAGVISRRCSILAYEGDLASGFASAGQRLSATLEAGGDFLSALLRTKQPLIFAESAVAGDGSDWSQIELGLLGDISVAMEVTVFDDGRHSDPEIFDQPSLVTLPGLCCGLILPGRSAVS